MSYRNDACFFLSSPISRSAVGQGLAVRLRARPGSTALRLSMPVAPKLPLELVYEQPAFARALMPCHATDSDPKAHPWDLALLETGGADC